MVQGTYKCELNRDEVGANICLPGAARNHKGGAVLLTRKAHLNPGHIYD